MPAKAKFSVTTALEVNFEGRPVPVTIVRRSRAKRYILRIHPTCEGIRLTMPPSGSLRRAQTFLEANGDWVCARLSTLPPLCRFQDGTIINYREKNHRITYFQCRKGRDEVWVETEKKRKNDSEVETMMPRLCVAPAGSSENLSLTLLNWLKSKARIFLSEAASTYARRLDVRFSRISIRDQKTRWGSCSTSGELSFSWRLIMAPPYVLDYLAAHEVTHLRHMDHSRLFWKTLRDLCPAADKAEIWLRLQGRKLHRYQVN
ncbi:MAG: SprT family zinc-dependent metalloprotease [Alphaproteobacteria bacterium]|nr:SprT family zinc-dependent metalloprotease [Alphaproteobacteria bacterium]